MACAPNLCNIDSIMTITELKAAQLLDNINTAILLFDRNLRLVTINTAGENLLSVSHRMICGRPAHEILPDTSWFIKTLQRTLDNKRAYTEWSLELNVQNDEIITVGCFMTPLMEEENCNAVIVELIDSQSISRVMKEENLLALHDAASKSLAGMAHEIKNPLGGLRGAAQLLERELNEDELKEYTKIIISEADRLHNLVDRMMTPKGALNLSDINIHEVLEYVHDIIQAEADEKLTVIRDYDPSLPNLMGDKEQLIQALLNVIRNAVQAITEVDNGKICLKTRVKHRCTIRNKQHKLCAQIEITDNGPGIPADIESEIFYPLITGRAEGTGLGLSITQSLIQKHGGSIDYDRLKNETTFKILLPLSQTDE